MLFFERILRSKTQKAPVDHRRAIRYGVGPAFPLKSVLNLVGCDEYNEPLKSADGRGWDWAGQLADLSATGASMQLPPATGARRGDPCHLKILLAECQFTIPCRVAYVRPLKDSVLFGLTFDSVATGVSPGYQQLLKLVAFGASLKAVAPKSSRTRVDVAGYIVEHFQGDFDAHLTVWRTEVGGAVEWFEFRLAEYCIRGRADTRTLEFASCHDDVSSPVAPAQAAEIHQLFQWVVPNLARTVPADIRESLQTFAA